MDTVRTLGLVLVLAALAVGLILGLVAWLGPAFCHARWEPDWESQWGWMSNCRVLVDGVLVPEDRVLEMVK